MSLSRLIWSLQGILGKYPWTGAGQWDYSEDNDWPAPFFLSLWAKSSCFVRWIHHQALQNNAYQKWENSEQKTIPIVFTSYVPFNHTEPSSCFWTIDFISEDSQFWHKNDLLSAKQHWVINRHFYIVYPFFFWKG